MAQARGAATTPTSDGNGGSTVGTDEVMQNTASQCKTEERTWHR